MTHLLNQADEKPGDADAFQRGATPPCSPWSVGSKIVELIEEDGKVERERNATGD
jgi:hypothetical protein